MKLTLDAIRDCLDGSIPGTLATCAADGTPNVTFVSQVDYVDSEHAALSFQFFSKTRENVLANPEVRVTVVNPLSGASYQLRLRYLRTESAGPLFERMKAKLAGIASHEGMAGVFRLRGSDVYRVLDIQPVPGPVLAVEAPRRNLLAALRQASARLAASQELDALFDQALATLRDCFGVEHSLLLLLAEAGDRLYTVASLGYARSGVGSEIAVGDGVIGVAAQQRTAICVPHATAEYSYVRAQREAALALGGGETLPREIPFPGLAEPHSQLAVPIVAGSRLLGVLYAESPEDRRFGYDDEDALSAYGAQLGTAIQLLQQSAAEDEGEPETASPRPLGAPVQVRHYAADDSIFLGEDYLIKGVAGAIFWKLAKAHAEGGRVEFCNRELRLDATLRLPEVGDNLETRLILLSRRLAERCDYLAIEKTGRGRFRFKATRSLRLVEAG
ncbi:GAF domain-containing protein [Stagnimonas aquatica]|uniref:GAF domain-containing protein n=1 Tax=Stagnimonas aquatica TaxID=2689987 RepID=A0A3N0VLS6_9GAMM|nr:GAF domain-containing protein [Stagnimonas aquatica]ROH93746.1 GAF domain-containing protein [Stagnimonas aquatica]